MSTKTKIQISFTIIVVMTIIFLMIRSALAVSFSYTLTQDKYYTWGIDVPTKLPIPDGFIPTEASLVIKGLTQIGDNASDSLYIHVIGDPGLDLLWKEFLNTEPGDYFAIKNSRATGNGTSLPIVDDTFVLKYNDNVIGKENLTINFSNINNPDSWVWKIFKSPFNFTLTNLTVKPFSSALLVFIDYAGTGNVGIGLDPVGTGSFGFDMAYLEVTIETYKGAFETYEKRVFKINLNTPPYISNDQ